MNESSIKEKFVAISKHPDPFWFLDGRKERFNKYPFRTIKNAIIRRIIYFAVNIGVLGKAIRVKTFWGKKILVPTRSSFHLLEKGFLEGEDFRLTGYIINTLKNGDIFIDGGANYGWYTLIASELVGNGGRVHSFEPTGRSFAILQANVAHRDNTVVNHAALWKESGTIQFNDFGFKFDVANTVIQEKERIEYYDKIVTHNKDHRIIPVSAVTLWNYCNKNGIHPTFIKLDCEGAELEILSAAENLLRYHPIIATELLGSSLRSGSGTKLINLLEHHGYRMYKICDDFSLAPLDDTKGIQLANVIFK
jgi:FkbM family methyltransferase